MMAGGMAPTISNTAGSGPDASDDNAITAKTAMPAPIAILSRRLPVLFNMVTSVGCLAVLTAARP